MATFHQILNLRGPWGPEGWSPLTWAALLQLLHCHRLGGRRRVLHTAHQCLHEPRPVGRADAYVVPRLVLEPLLASSVQAHQDRGPAGGGERGQLQEGWAGGGRSQGLGHEGQGPAWCGRLVLLTWTCCFAGFPPRGLWPGTSSACARGSGLRGGGQMRQSWSRGPWPGP